MTTFSEFRANIKDIARPNRFLISITGSILNKPGLKQLPDNYKFLTQKASIPKFDINGPEIKYRGTKMNLRGDYKKDPLTLTFWNDIDWNIRNFFESWTGYIVDISTVNVRKENKDYRFGTSVFIEQIGQGDKNNIISRYEFHNVAPFEISEIALDQTAENQVEEFSVIFQYSHWENKSVQTVHTVAEDSP